MKQYKQTNVKVFGRRLLVDPETSDGELKKINEHLIGAITLAREVSEYASMKNVLNK